MGDLAETKIMSKKYIYLGDRLFKMHGSLFEQELHHRQQPPTYAPSHITIEDMPEKEHRYWRLLLDSNAKDHAMWFLKIIQPVQIHYEGKHYFNCYIGSIGHSEDDKTISMQVSQVHYKYKDESKNKFLAKFEGMHGFYYLA